MQIKRYFSGSAAPAALTIGNFDGVHLGHQAMLTRTVEVAGARGLSPCALTFEPHPREFFAPDQAPTRLTTLREKLELLESRGISRTQVCRFDYRFAQIAAAEFIERIVVRGLNARWVLVGEDFRFGARRAGDLTLLRQAGARHGFEVEVQPMITANGVRVSSTAVREALAAGDTARAQRLLGRPYSISGRVVHNDKFGRKLGFPTANILMKHNRPPVWGIYAVEVSGAGDRPWPGVASLGVRPTVRREARAVLEVHLLDFDREIYGAHLRVDFLHKFRDEEKYADVETLRRQIARDVENTRDYFHRRDAETQRTAQNS
ncbi:MAG TPA: bifunctional riboflavin kinase/FAD synthetase [Burkholderiales bacterium]|nr:bifunctional riboflavin kinase/FAD synthetase [Burkholderiales bacterium]